MSRLKGLAPESPESQEAESKDSESAVSADIRKKDEGAPTRPEGTSRWTKWQTIATIIATLIVVSGYIGYRTICELPPVRGMCRSSSALPTQPDKKSRAENIALTIVSDPSGAHVYLNWNRQGTTPLSMTRKPAKGLLVVMKEGFIPQSKEIGDEQSEQLRFALQADTNLKTGKVLLLISDDSGSKVNFDLLRSELLRGGLSVAGAQESEVFKNELRQAGGLSNTVFLAWSRPRFGVDILLKSDVYLHTKDLGKQNYGYEGIQETLKGTFRTEAKIEVESVDLRTGSHIASFSGAASAFANDEPSSIHEALGKAAVQIARAARQKISR